MAAGCFAMLLLVWCIYSTSKSPGKPSRQQLNKVPMFKSLSEGMNLALESCADDITYEEGKVIITQGERGDAFYILKSGTAEVRIDGQHVRLLGPGDFFGQNALLRDEPRGATVLASSQVNALRITREHFRELGLHERFDLDKRFNVGAQHRAVAVKPPSAKTPSQRALLAKALRDNKNLSAILALDDARIHSLIDLAWKEEVRAETELISLGDEVADYFYIVQDGEFQVTIPEAANNSEFGLIGLAEATSVTKMMTKGDSFGEIALLYAAPRSATVKAKADAVVWVIDRKNFKDIMALSSEDIAVEHAKYMETLDLLSPLTHEDRLELAKAFTEIRFYDKETIFEQGDEGDCFFILVEGSVAVIEDGKEKASLVATPQKVCCFGERALLQQEPRTATINVTSAFAKALTLDKQTFDMLLGPLEDVRSGKRRKPAEHQMKTAHSIKQVNHTCKIRRNDLESIGLLGCGGFGSVTLVQHVDSKETYALKQMSKGHVVKLGMVEAVISERNVQFKCDSPFIVKLHQTFSDRESLYLLLDAALGGELYATYSRRNLWGKETHAKFYASGVVFAFEHLHRQKVIYRDLKPENLLLTDDGRCKLTDMGLAKEVLKKTYTTCGTPDYLAPEVLRNHGYNRAVDWWALGILVFELMSGHPPFESKSTMDTYKKIVKGIDAVSFPDAIKGPVGLEDFVRGLCHSTPADRLPMKFAGTGHIKVHPWLKDFDWSAAEKRRMPPPYKPGVSGKTDLANFDSSRADMPEKVKYEDDGTGVFDDFATGE